MVELVGSLAQPVSLVHQFARFHVVSRSTTHWNTTRFPLLMRVLTVLPLQRLDDRTAGIS